MSVTRQIVITCDGPKVGIPCTHTYVSDEQSVYPVRRELLRRGWSRQHHHDTVLDLCRPCTGRAVGKIVTAPNHGRPRKAGKK